MPVQYTGILEEHRAVRERAGPVRPVAHGRAVRRGRRRGRGARRRARQRSADARRRPRPVFDDLVAPTAGSSTTSSCTGSRRTRFLVVANASNAPVVSGGAGGPLAGWRAILDDRSLATSLVAIQGPRAAGILAPLTDVRPDGPALLRDRRGPGSRGFRRSSRGRATRARTASSLRRTGSAARRSGTALADAGKAPASAGGLAPRDTLRLEAGMPLYGNELDRATNPFEAGLGRVVKLEKPATSSARGARAGGRDGPAKQLVGLSITGRGIARHGYPCRRRPPHRRRHERHPIADPGQPIAMAYVARRCRAGYDAGRRGSRAAGLRRGRAAALLQAASPAT
jgi:aminomethyltransferase